MIGRTGRRDGLGTGIEGSNDGPFEDSRDVEPVAISTLRGLRDRRKTILRLSSF